MNKNIILILIILLVFILSCSKLEAKEDDYLASDLTKKIIKFNSKDSNLLKQRRVIIYSLKFVELNSKVFKNSSAKLSVDDLDYKGNWHIWSNDSRIEITKNDEVESSFELQGESGLRKSNVCYSSWIATIEDNKAVIEINEEVIEMNRENKMDILLELNPKRFNLKSKDVLTEIKVEHNEYKTKRADIRMTSWINSDLKIPLAFLTQKIKGTEYSMNKYFALYLTAVAVDYKNLEEGGIITIGDIGDINYLFADRIETSKSREELGLYFSLSGSRIEYNRLAESNRIYTSIDKNEVNTLYDFRIEHALFNGSGLFLLGEMKKDITTGEEDIISLGIGDEVSLSDYFTTKLTYLPICYSLSSRDYSSAIFDFILKLDRSNWNLSYQLEYTESRELNRINLEYKLSQDFSLEGRWNRSDLGNEESYLGLKWKWF